MFLLNKKKNLKKLSVNLGNLRDLDSMYPLVVKETHKFHLVDPSYWPITLSFVVFNLVLSIVYFLHGNSYFTSNLIFIWLTALLCVIYFWINDVVYESCAGHHTTKVQRGLRLGFSLFIVSEFMFFFTFFWSYFHYSLAPSLWIGNIWPPFLFNTFIPNYAGLPLLNTLLLLTSGISLTVSHHSLINNSGFVYESVPKKEGFYKETNYFLDFIYSLYSVLIIKKKKSFSNLKKSYDFWLIHQFFFPRLCTIRESFFNNVDRGFVSNIYEVKKKLSYYLDTFKKYMIVSIISSVLINTNLMYNSGELNKELHSTGFNTKFVLSIKNIFF